MKLKALTLGLCVGFAVAIAPSCGGTSGKCGPANCAGCCDANGTCLTDPTASKDSTCGNQGNACADCTATKATCQASTHTCVGGSDAGTGGGATGGGTGGGATGGGTGGGATGGGATGGGTGGTLDSCSPVAPTCTAGSECLVTDTSGPTFNCYPGACDLVAQDCPTSTDRCVYVAGTSGGPVRGCAPAGSLTQGATCDPANDQCGKGLLCTTASGASTCSKFCFGATGCSSSELCSGVLQISGTPEKPMLCMPKPASCDPLLQNCANSTDGCYPTQQGNLCAPAGSATSGQACANANTCAKGYICTGTTTGACHALCNLDGGAPTCATGSCSPLSGASFGACN